MTPYSRKCEGYYAEPPGVMSRSRKSANTLSQTKNHQEAQERSGTHLIPTGMNWNPSREKQQVDQEENPLDINDHIEKIAQGN